MPLQPGTRLGPYEVLSLIGAGGMGEVYRARDTRLDRTVAVKVLAPELADDAEFQARFTREAKAISALNHAHICGLYDIGREHDTDYLVLELLEGETLATRLERGPLPLTQVLRFGIEIADALEAAHRHGIVHRDLKPGNVMLTAGGTKLLDFGLAKHETGPTAQALSMLATAPRTATAQGTIIGTLPYMAPEQVQGQPADARTDIFALGAVLYEMVTGRRAFEGKTQASLIAKILETEVPAVSSLVPAGPPLLDRVVHGCLAKQSADRWQDIHDVKMQLQWLQQRDGELSASGSPARSPWIPWGVATIAVAALLGALMLRPPASVPSPTGGRVQFETTLPEDMRVDAFFDEAALSPDGQQVVFSATSKGQAQLFLRDLASLRVVPLDDTENGYFPFWSPDGRAIAFFAGGKLKRIPVSGGPAMVVANATGWLRRFTGGGTWANGTILFALFNGSIVRVPDTGGTPTAVDGLPWKPGQTAFAWPRFLPDGRRFLISKRGDPALYVASLDKAGIQRIEESASRAVYAAKHVLFFRGANVFARPFDPERLVFTGPEQLLVAGAAYFAASDNGTVVYRPGRAAVSRLRWLNRHGEGHDAIIEAGAYMQVVLSPRGNHAAVVRSDSPSSSRSDLWDVDLATGVLSRLTADGSSVDPSWSPDERRIAFGSDSGIVVKDLASGAEEPLVVWKDRRLFMDQWTPDGLFIIARYAGQFIYAIPVNGEHTPRLLLDTPFIKDEVHVSPDGNWVAYNSDESGRWEVFVATFPAFTSRRQVSTQGGVQPQWSGNGRELFYLASDGAMMSIGLTPSPAAASTPPSRLFSSRIQASPGLPQYAVVANGERFLALEPVEGEQNTLTFLLNWLNPKSPDDTRAPR
jgi:serine/threonine protein kinase/Tol biopolymer transport system component